MAIAFVGATGAASTTTTTTQTNTRSLTSGNVAIVVGSTYTGGGATTHTLTDSRGNTIPAATTSTSLANSRMSVWIVSITTGGAGSFTLTAGVSSTGLNLDVYEYSGLSTTLDGTPTSNAVASSSVTVSAVTLSTGTSLVFSAGYDQNTVATLGASGGYTGRLNNQNTTDSETSAGFDQIAPGAGSYGNTITTSGAPSALHGAVIGLLAVVSGPTITVQPKPTSVRAGATASFSVTATGATSYQWRKNTSTIGGATSSSYTTPATVLADNGASFDCIVSDGVTPVTSSAATLNVQAGTPSTLGQFDPSLRILSWF